jgi:hypothetical protein
MDIIGGTGRKYENGLKVINFQIIKLSFIW